MKETEILSEEYGVTREEPNTRQQVRAGRPVIIELLNEFIPKTIKVYVRGIRVLGSNLKELPPKTVHILNGVNYGDAISVDYKTPA